ncbi:hypothetical protein BJX65DRAFT_310685 [Aspergillus insuetus]
MELILPVLDFMGCGASKRKFESTSQTGGTQELELLGAHDQLHPANREALGDYLEQFWSRGVEFLRLDPESCISLSQVCHHAHATLTPYLCTIYRTRVIDLGEIKQGQVLDIRSRITHRQTLKFVEELVIQSSVSWINCRGSDCLLHKCIHVATLGRELMPLLRGLKRNALVSFTWQIHTCVPQSILGPRGYLRRHQRNMHSLHLTGPSCGSNADPSRRPSLSRFHSIRHFSWSLHTINHCIALREFFASPAVSHGLEELTLRGSYLDRQLRDWKELQKPWSWMQARNVFAFKVLDLQPNETWDKVVFPALKKLTLYNIGFRYAVRDLVAAFNMHNLRSLKLRSYYSSAILCTIAELADEYCNNTNGTIPLTCLDITVRASGDRDTESLERFFAVAPYLRDVYIQPDAYDQSSFKPHLRAIFTLEGQRSIKRFIYQRRLQVEGDVSCAWDDTDAPMVWDEEVRGLFASSRMTHVGICDHLPTLMHNILLFPSPPTWEVLHIRTLPTIHEGHEKNNPHNPVFEHTFPPPKAIHYSTGSPTLIDTAPLPYSPTFTKTEITDFLTFAAWAFGSGGFPCLRVLVLGRVNRAYWNMSGPGSGSAGGSEAICLVRDRESGCSFRVCGSNSGQGPDKALMEEDLDFLSVL